MTTFTSGRAAEQRAADYLIAEGFEVIARNWRTKYCEIDIVAQRGQTVYFVEVKYRKSSIAGVGTEYITPKKLKQMQFTAQSWVHQNHWPGDYELAALSIDGSRITFIDNIEA